MTIYIHISYYYKGWIYDRLKAQPFFIQIHVIYIKVIFPKYPTGSPAFAYHLSTYRCQFSKICEKIIFIR